MASSDNAKPLLDAIGGALAFRDRSLESRSQWGSISFERASPDFRRIFEILAHLSVLPLEYLTDAAITQIQSEVVQVVELFGQIDKFNIEQQTPTQVRDQLVQAVHLRADQLYSVASPWIPFLAYQKGDVAKNIETLTVSVAHAQSLIDGAKTSIEKRQEEIETIITQAREASAAAGAAVFTQDFKNEAASLATSATRWLGATGILAALTLAFAVGMWIWQVDTTELNLVVQRFGGKFAVLAVLFTATLWCGKTYKSLMHLATVNRHRALSLQTFQAFSHAASDDPTKDAVLMETTRAIFGSVPTGFLDGKGSPDSDLRVIEIAKSLGGRSPTGQAS